MRIAPWLLAFWLFYPFCAAAGSSTPADPAAPGECAERTETPIRSGNSDPKPQGQDEAMEALREAAAQRRAHKAEREAREAEQSPTPSDSQAAPSESDPARR